MSKFSHASSSRCRGGGGQAEAREQGTVCVCWRSPPPPGARDPVWTEATASDTSLTNGSSGLGQRVILVVQKITRTPNTPGRRQGGRRQGEEEEEVEMERVHKRRIKSPVSLVRLWFNMGLKITKMQV